MWQAGSFSMNSLRRLFVSVMAVLVMLAGLPVVTGNVTDARARQGFAVIAVDARTGRILFARNADSPRLPASITKVMTAYMLFREIRRGRFSFSSRLVISRHAASMPPSRLGLKPGSSITVDQALRAILTKSANDIAVAIAENIAGSESRFARRMTQVARSMGMTRTTFRNASGLPRPKNITTARDLATLALRIQRDFPKLYKRYFGLRHFRFRGHVYRNHNRLLGRVKGVDGLKTGYTRASGFNLAATARRNGRRVVAVVLGAPTSRARNAYMARLIERMFRSGKLRRGTMIAAVAGTPPGWNGRRVRVANATRGADKAKRQQVNLPKPALAGLVRRVTAPTPRPRPDGIARLAALARKKVDRSADEGREQKRRLVQAEETARIAKVEAISTADNMSVARSKVEGRIFASVKPAPMPEDKTRATSLERRKPSAGDVRNETRAASLGRVVAMEVRPVPEQEHPTAAADPAGKNETVVTKSDALLPVSVLLRPRRPGSSTGRAVDERAGSVADVSPAMTESRALPRTGDGQERASGVSKDGKAVESELVTASVTTDEKRLADAEERRDPDMERRLKSWNIQLGSYPARDGAQKRIDDALKRFRPLLRGKEGFTMVFRKDGKTYYRARFAGFNRRTALRACRMMKRKGISCFALAPAANRS